ncbi:8-amino-7-oxononanoate synthase [Endozoicomonas montiporae]|uniref:8-amino-7-oxononanoate synthase n=2 Tax=Endozoicomonas montiporae TaxID=1027273 RepID=A0A081N2R7_9GAMM|nr:8-amino-7-oxononanoate synthase [Endozoicomonas montiporae]KEQ12740.1 8-amino-7-oxononanoate synthase [Endozoicomonas montiporae]
MNFELEERLVQRKAQQLYRHRVILDSPQKPEAIVDGHPCLMFCSNDYLGLADHPDIRAAFQKASDVYGVGSGASALINGHSRAHRQLEEELAEYTGRPRVLLFSTGYMANLGTISALLNPGDALFQDRLNHASLLDAGRLSGARFQRYQHLDMENLEQRLKKNKARRTLVATDGVFSMDGDKAPLKELITLTRQYQAGLMVDDAHAFGCVGKGGRGSLNENGLSVDEVPILMATLGKAFGTAGAFVAGSEALIENLIQFARSYIYTTAMPPAIAEASRASLKIVEREDWRRDKLTANIRYFRRNCESLGIPLTASESAIQPIHVGSIEKVLRVSKQLLDLGVLVTPIRPPTVPAGSSRLRVTLSTAHTREHIDRLIDALQSIVWPKPEQAA